MDDRNAARPTLPIVLIGPMGAGKTTLSRALSAAVGVPYAPLDWVGFHTMVRDGLDVRAYEADETWADKHRRRLPHLIAVAEDVIRSFPRFLLDFGAGHAHFETAEEQARLRAVLGPLPNVFLVMPCADLDEAEANCVARDKARWAQAGHEWDATRAPFHRAFVRSESFRQVAKHTVFTEGRSVEDCVAEMLERLR